MESEKRIGNYVIGEPVGRGGMGIVYRGRHATLPREVAIKSISPRGRLHDLRRLRNRFEREAFVQSQLDHPSIVKIYDYIVSEQTYYIVMEYVEGRSLGQLLSQAPSGLGVGRALDLFEQILDAVAYAHTFVYRDEQGAALRGIVHRDLKPPNILIAPEDRVKITDFGIVKLVGADTTDTSGVAYGSPRYVSPEQARGESVDQRSDIYSLGVILYEMLTGVPPFGGRPGDPHPPPRTAILRAHLDETPRPPTELNPAITPEVERVICRALEKKPERRYATADDFYRSLRRARGLEAGEEAAAAPADEAAPEATRPTDNLGGPTGEVWHDTLQTQPIEARACEVCGADRGPEEVTCRECGHDLGASPATAGLARQEITGRRSTRGWIFVVILLALLALSIPLIYYARHRGEAPDGAGAPGALTTTPPAAHPSPTAPGPPAAAAGPALELKARAGADSSYDGYNTKPLTDGVTDVRRIGGMRYNDGNWVSAEGPGAHWIELDFGRPARVTTVYVYWGFDRGRYMPSREVELQAPDGAGGWRTVARLETAGNYDRTAFESEPFVAETLRVLQPPRQGPPNRPFVMWVREVQAFGSYAD